MRPLGFAVACAAFAPMACGSRSELDAQPVERDAQRMGPDADCGHAVSFSNLGDDVYLPGVNAVSSTGFTWDFWFNATTLPTSSAVDISAGATLLTAADGVYCEDIYVGFGSVHTPANKLAFDVDGAGECDARDTTPLVYTPSGGFATGKWYFVAVSHDYKTGTSRLYLDGAVVASKTASVMPIPRILPVTIGRWTDRAVTQYGQFRGAIDELHIYERALTPAEVSTEYGAGAGRYGSPNDVGLSAGYHFDEGSGRAASNLAARAAAATLESTAGWAPGFICRI